MPAGSSELVSNCTEGMDNHHCRVPYEVGSLSFVNRSCHTSFSVLRDPSLSSWLPLIPSTCSSSFVWPVSLLRHGRFSFLRFHRRCCCLLHSLHARLRPPARAHHTAAASSNDDDHQGLSSVLPRCWFLARGHLLSCFLRHGGDSVQPLWDELAAPTTPGQSRFFGVFLLPPSAPSRRRWSRAMKVRRSASLASVRRPSGACKLRFAVARSTNVGSEPPHLRLENHAGMWRQDVLGEAVHHLLLPT